MNPEATAGSGGTLVVVAWFDCTVVRDDVPRRLEGPPSPLQKGLPSVTPEEKPLLTSFHCSRLDINGHGE